MKNSSMTDLLYTRSSTAWYTRKDTTQATAHWLRATPAAFQPEPSSRFTAEMAATQGVYSRVNTRKLRAVTVENRVPRASAVTSAPAPVRMPRVEMTDSLAMKPVMRAVETRQSPKPRG